ncbi:hypothetical protein KPL78_22500 [Roseomonas sp. HJA6]|uniref:DUF2939 domain-containing protein n=1 Tax=Roseomonas alba TaxID=2846776 RepID=A0ABS7AEB6_9PROT|nr:hypothetical protein [Neoroseomonas alba]MBW6400647.1 hypothetical protein [Neoroseomonas alba]
MKSRVLARGALALGMAVIAGGFGANHGIGSAGLEVSRAQTLLASLLPIRSAHAQSTLTRYAGGYDYPRLLREPAVATALDAMLTRQERQHLVRSFNGVVMPMRLEAGRLSGAGGVPRQMDYNTAFISVDVASMAVEVGLLMDGKASMVSRGPRDGLSPAARAWMAELPADSRNVRFRQAGAAGGGAGAAAPSGAAPVAQATAWRLTAPSPAQWSLSVPATERGGSLELSCTAGRGSPYVLTTYLSAPRGWRFTGFQTTIQIDGVTRAMEVDGADSGFVLSDATENNTSTFSQETRRLLATGRELRVNGLVASGRPRTLMFNIAGGEPLFAAFDQRCRGLR